MNSTLSRLRGAGEARSLFAVAFGPSVVALAIVALLGVLTMATQQSDMAAVFAVVSELWLAVHQVPVTVSDITVSTLPLIPTLLLMVGVARMSRSASDGRPLRELRTVVLCAVGGPLLFTAIALAVVNDATSTFTVGTPPPLVAFVDTAVVHLVAALIGIGYGRRHEVSDLLRVPLWVEDALAVATRALAAFFAVGAAIVVVRLLVQWSTVGSLVGAGNDAIGMLGLTALSVLYMPNVMIGAAGITVGAGAQVGPVAVSLFSSAPGQAPAIPLLAILPAGDSPRYLLVLLLVPAVVAVATGRRCAAADPELGPTLKTIGVAALATAAGITAASWLAGGQLGGSGRVGLDLPELFFFTFAWIMLVGALAALAVQQFGDTRAVRSTKRAGRADGPAGYTTFADEPDDADVAAPIRSDADAPERYAEPDETPVSDPDGAAEHDRSEHDRSESCGATHDAASDSAEPDDPETGDFDSVRDAARTGGTDAARGGEAPTTARDEARVPSAHEPGTRARGGRPAPVRDPVVADVEELDSYTFGE
ncbi:DUF6350 family protein [Tsukamurella sp. 8F]|nr:DUF6350 family protein [Tsukamurella sp. 8F]MDF0589411.1 DUF6350 family protein [Tsukamurella sp. 8F]